MQAQILGLWHEFSLLFSLTTEAPIGFVRKKFDDREEAYKETGHETKQS